MTLLHISNAQKIIPTLLEESEKKLERISPLTKKKALLDVA